MLTSAKRLCGVGMIVAGVCMVSSGSAFAGLDIPDFTMTWWASGDGQDPETFDPADFGNVINHGDGLFEYLGGRSHDLWTLDWDALVDPDPFIDGQIVVTNNDSEFQTFFLLMTLNGITPVEEPSVMNGEVAATVTNNQLTGDATFRALEDDAIYSAYVDLVDIESDTPVKTLWEYDYDLVATGGLASESDDLAFGPEAGPAANDNIAILLRFELSPGDSASVSGVFNIVPAPAALPALAVFGLLGGSRRRRSA
jgi:hypothetical protein